MSSTFKGIRESLLGHLFWRFTNQESPNHKGKPGEVVESWKRGASEEDVEKLQEMPSSEWNVRT